MKSETLLSLDNRREEERSRIYVDLPQTNLTEEQKTMAMQCQEETETCHDVKYRRHGSHLGGVKIRHKRQVLQDMARPLKHWLYKHRDNPYPTKTEKVLLALGSHMTLVQVSNWFANARRRLKNTVRQPDLSWALRIKLYNKYIQGNAERLSVCSDDTHSDDEECPLQASVGQSNLARSSSLITGLQKQNGILALADSASSDDSTPPSKYKSSLLNRYLNDTLRHMMAAKETRRNRSGLFGSKDCHQDVVSPSSSCETEANFVYHMDTLDFTSSTPDREWRQEQSLQRGSRQSWKELHAAVALTSLARGQTCMVDQLGSMAPDAASERSSTTAELFSTITGRTRVSGQDSGLLQSCTTGPTLTSRIIQKSSHISEVQTIQVSFCK
ncbi:homeobox protein Mohawk-like [Gouania willdenowi]|uniref:Homeobox protein Mohawk-like n=1 Tax=Gouania willdenowi TaxID=441366 RepID=A0A8C5GNF4_GOUWI|nr:homeobox protein Mohawk-like [Gouania willdenowi]